LWHWLIALDRTAFAELLAYCVAATIKPERGPHIFSRVSKALIAEAVTEGVNAEAASAIGSLKKGEMAERAEALLPGTGWLPAMLRA
jgi:ParB family chromosome partitioning protein